MDTVKRNGLTARQRWQIFNRDKFACQYCGKSTKNDRDIVLEVDHIKPVSEGGTNDMENLITSCLKCNHGKMTDNLNVTDIQQRIKNRTNYFQNKENTRTGFSVTRTQLFILESINKNRSEALRIIMKYWEDGHKKHHNFFKFRK